MFSRSVDGAPVQFIRPIDTDRPSWSVYEQHQYLGTLHAQTDVDGCWHVQTLCERYPQLEDAVRALRRPSA
ncbi:hypothetical protein [Streptomyces abikoensis]|uniref:Uncharacterized protein n=1 Tax=Streptomyces abikoensis TaxID=97398 RepID=A0ABW7TCQ9_9ACTN